MDLVPQPPQPVLLTTRELAVRWRLTDWTLRQWRAHGIGPAYIRLGPGRASEVRYRILDIEEYEKAGRIVPGNPIPSASVPASSATVESNQRFLEPSSQTHVPSDAESQS